MNQLVENFMKSQDLNCELENNVSLDNLKEEFNSYVFKIYLCGYVKKTIVFSAIQIKKKVSQTNKKEELSLNIIDPNFKEERINLIADNSNDVLSHISESIVKEDNYNYDEISHDRGILKAINTLTDRQKEILHRCIIIGENDTVVAKKLGITKQGVNKVKKSAINKIRENLYSRV